MTSLKNLVLADTSAWICFFARKNFPVIKKWMTNLLEEDRIAITGPIFLELIQGTRNQKERVQTESQLKALHWLQINDNHWQKTADLSFKLRRKEITISAIDALISIIAIDYSCELLYYDSDYDLIAENSKLNTFFLLETGGG